MLQLNESGAYLEMVRARVIELYEYYAIVGLKWDDTRAASDFEPLGIHEDWAAIEGKKIDVVVGKV